MQNTLHEYSHITAPATFAACVSNAARRAVRQTPRRINRPLRIALLAALMLTLSTGAVALVRSWMASDLFSETQGFAFPEYEWGSSASIRREDTLIFYNHTAQVQYQYQNDRLIGIEIVFNRANQPFETDMTALYSRIVKEMQAAYPSAHSTSTTYGNAETAALQQALRDYLNAGSASESERIYDALEEKDPALADRAAASVAAANRNASSILLTWEDRETNTAIALHASFETEEIVRMIRITLTQLPTE